MKIVDKRDLTKVVTFEDLDIGDVYKDEDGRICIKVSNQFKDEIPNIIYYECEDAEWETDYEYRYAEAVILNTELVIND